MKWNKDYLSMKINFLLGLMICFSINQIKAQDLPMASPKAKVMQRIGITDVTVEYFRPSVNGRKIWGQLIPFGYQYTAADGSSTAPWRMGANNNTTIEFNHNLKINDKELIAGKYAVFSAIKEDGSTDVLISKNHSGWGSMHYKEEDVVLSFNTKMDSIKIFYEQLTFGFEEVSNNSATLKMKWENLGMSIPIQVNTKEIAYQYLLDNERSFEAINPGTKSSWHQAAALYLTNNNFHLDKALYWSNIAIDEENGGIKNFPNLTTNVILLALNDKANEANELLDEAFKIAPNLNIMMFFGRQASTFELREIEKRNYLAALKKFPKATNAWVAEFQLSQVYLADDNKKQFLKYIDKAIEGAPSSYVERIKAVKAKNI
ncbi:MAG: DUF2911 domain-containing protein [Saonia sp.]